MDKKFIKGTYQEMIQEIRKKDASSSEEANRWVTMQKALIRKIGVKFTKALVSVYSNI